MARRRLTLDDVVRALREHGWTQTNHGVFAPADPLVLPTPENIPDDWWGQPTYQDYRLIKIAAVRGSAAHYWTLEGPPWVAPRERKVGAEQVIEFIEETTSLVAESKGASA
ncbi:hypothetical protein [Streptomyces sp. NPDC057557]|uniref:hypothetical protein n=1 Tax=Streptomyces sp. NPDC057557 TaxID=3346167 RepID=UPI0036785B89